MDPVMLSRVLKHYKRVEVQKEIVNAALNKEAVGSYGGKGYAKRPDVLMYPNDVLEQVKNGITSFHVSEENWSHPQRISLEMKKKEYDELRKGWDLVLDIDCPYWEFSRIISWLFIKALKDHGIFSLSAKFSGNKGFHIGVPFEAFPEKINETLTKDLFPEGPRRIAAYLLDYISKKYVTINLGAGADKISFGGRFNYTLDELEQKTGKKSQDFVTSYCESCGKKSSFSQAKEVQFVCPLCGKAEKGEETEQYKTCSKCSKLMEKIAGQEAKKCCSNPKQTTIFNPLSIVEVDTVLIAPRHLYRAPYSYHEKSGLISIPIHVDELLTFEKEQAEPEKVQTGKNYFLRRENVKAGEAKNLLVEAFDFAAKKEQKKQELERLGKKGAENKEFEEIQFAIPEQFFPPCVEQISKGLEDGKKRAVFIMINFLSSCNWEYDKIEEWLKKWNEKNAEQLREQSLLGQLRYAKQHNKKVLPPNCDNTAYYKAFGVCKPDAFCKYTKNPANYAIKKARYAQREKAEGRGRRVKREGKDSVKYTQ
jgi:predicted RNA-binding Zn-ribbon protein involved in translation (DUF1610 family)